MNPTARHARASSERLSDASSASCSRVFVALSGGVDSAVALMLLERGGEDVQALFMKNWEEDDGDGYCAAAVDLADARSVCRTLGVRLHTVNFATEYWDRVFERFLAEYRGARTPNPDVLCNQEVKFDVFLEHALDLGATELATGHYARVDCLNGRHRLLRATDEDKDQTFFLHRLNQQQLARVRFPLGELTKARVRALARDAGLAPHDKKDSTGICFIGERPFKEFLQRYIESERGPIEDAAGTVIGEHQGLSYYTIGQRQGLGIGGRPAHAGADGGPWYVTAKVGERNALVVAEGRKNPALYASALLASEVHWIAGEPPALPLVASARIRHRQSLQLCEVRAASAAHPACALAKALRPAGLPEPGTALEVHFRSPQWAVAPGQSIAFYHNDECLGGAVIDAAAR